MFRCVVKSSSGQSVTSNAAKLTVSNSGSLTITAQPTNVTAEVGKVVTFKVTATGASSYQWQASTDGGKTWVNSGAGGNRTATLSFTVAAAHNGYMFRCVVKSSSGQSVTSSAAKLTIANAGPTITEHPDSLTAAAGAKATFTVKASGSGLTYQWEASTDGGKTWKPSGAGGNSTATLSFTVLEAHDGYMFRCVVKSSSGQSETSKAAKLTVE